MLRGTDYSRSVRVVDRLLARSRRHPFSTPIQIALGAACYPMHAMGAESLKRWAVSHPMACCRGCIDTPDTNAIKRGIEVTAMKIDTTKADVRPGSPCAGDRVPTLAGAGPENVVTLPVAADYTDSASATSCASRSTATRSCRSPSQIRPDGKITLPLVGDLEANGRTPIELRDDHHATVEGPT